MMEIERFLVIFYKKLCEEYLKEKWRKIVTNGKVCGIIHPNFNSILYMEDYPI